MGCAGVCFVLAGRGRATPTRPATQPKQQHTTHTFCMGCAAVWAVWRAGSGQLYFIIQTTTLTVKQQLTTKHLSQSEIDCIVLIQTKTLTITI